MKAWLLPAFTGIQSMTLADTPNPSPGPGQVILQLHFAALNPADAYLALSQYPAKPTFPHILGREGVGTVLSVGPGVADIHPGETRLILRSEVGVNRPGTLAQQVAVDAAYTAPVPQGWSLPQAAGAPLVYLTAWQALTQWPDLPPNATILITGASGGVGVASIQLAHALGHTVIALSRSEDKSVHLRQQGAALTLNPTDPHWHKTLKARLAAPPTENSELRTPNFVDLAIDNIGGDTFNRLLDLMAPHGRISCVGRLAGPVPSFNTAALFFRRLRIGGVAVGTYTVEECRTAWRDLLATLQKTGAQPLIDHIFPFTEVPAAFARLAQGPLGKVVIEIAP
jgi:NADPH:quinone reductase